MAPQVIADSRLSEFFETLDRGFSLGFLIGQQAGNKTHIVHICEFSPIVDDAEDLEPTAEVGAGGRSVSTERETSKASGKRSLHKIRELEEINEGDVSDFAREIWRSCPGGLAIQGIYLMWESHPDFLGHAASMAKLNKLLKKLDIPRRPREFWTVAQIQPQTRKPVVKALDVQASSVSSLDWKWQPSAGTSWVQLRTTIGFDLDLPISDSDINSSYTERFWNAFRTCAEEPLKEAVCLIDGELYDEGEKLGDCLASREDTTVYVEVLWMPHVQTEAEANGTAAARMRFTGKLLSLAFVHGRATVGEALQFLKEDILDSLNARWQMHEDSLVIGSERDAPFLNHELPSRIFTPLPTAESNARKQGGGASKATPPPSAPILFGDYLFPGETLEDSVDSLSRVLGLTVSDSELDIGAMREQALSSGLGGGSPSASGSGVFLLSDEDTEVPLTPQNSEGSADKPWLTFAFLALLISIVLAYLSIYTRQPTEGKP